MYTLLKLLFIHIPLIVSTSTSTFSLEHLTEQNTLSFRVPAGAYSTKVLRVHDGDTAICAFELWGQQFHSRVRFKDICAPELNTIEGKQVRDVVQTRIEGKLGILQVDKNIEKYGRILGDLIIDDESINEWLSQNFSC